MIRQFKLFFFVISVGISIHVHGQYIVSKKDDALLIKNNILGVVFMEKDEKLVKKLGKKPEELEAYESGIETYNKLIKQAIESEWDVSQQVEFLSQEDADKIIKEENSHYCLLMVGERADYKLGDFYFSEVNDRTVRAEIMRSYHYARPFTSREIKIIWGPKDRRLAATFFPAAILSIGSVTYMVQNLKNQVNDCLDNNVTSLSSWKSAIDKETPEIKEKTLLIAQPLISGQLQKVIDKDKVEEYYKYKYKVVSIDELDSLVTTKNKDYVYALVVPSGYQEPGSQVYNYYVADASNGRNLFFTGTSLVGSNALFHWGHLVMISKKLK